MTLTLELTPETEKRLAEEAARRGQSPTDTALRFVEEALLKPPAAPDAENQAFIDLLRQWREEDASMTPEEADQAEREFEEFKTNMNANRAAEGRPPVYP